MEAANHRNLLPEVSDGSNNVMDLNIATLNALPAKNIRNTHESDLRGGRHEGPLYDTPP